ncbi:MAG: hypothetical protein H6626_01325 [Pseudobdellovibrionaceae bacterium]|nr:MAG: hypothetical protein H6626_01325 [Pseudobdellovibrionaceae bacterium]
MYKVKIMAVIVGTMIFGLLGCINPSGEPNRVAAEDEEALLRESGCTFHKNLIHEGTHSNVYDVSLSCDEVESKIQIENQVRDLKEFAKSAEEISQDVGLKQNEQVMLKKKALRAKEMALKLEIDLKIAEARQNDEDQQQLRTLKREINQTLRKMAKVGCGFVRDQLTCRNGSEQLSPQQDIRLRLLVEEYNIKAQAALDIYESRNEGAYVGMSVAEAELLRNRLISSQELF